MDKLKRVENPEEREELEDQILRLVEQDEQMDSLTKPEPKVDESDNINETHNLDLEGLDEREVIRLQRQAKKEAKDAKYRADSKLNSVDEELLRAQLMNEALASNEDFAYQKLRKAPGAKNKSKKRTEKY
jgi:hypothetical protein